MFVDKKRHFVCVWHRRAGKTRLVVNMAVASSQLRVGAYYYLLPLLNQARRVIWRGMGSDGIPFIDHFPKELLAKPPNNADMFIEFKNGSTFQLLGADKYDALLGGNPLQIIYDEYATQNPAAREFLIPILAENKGQEVFIFTPRGTNHGFTLFNNAKENPEWFCELLTVEDTRRPDGTPVVDVRDIDTYRKSGWSEDRIQQEFYCSFTAAVRGAYFSPQLKRMEEDKRIYDFPIRTDIPVDTYWDLGALDATAIWFSQERHDGIFAINYYENHLVDMNHYIHKLQEFQQEHNIVYRHHFAPHDGAHKRLSLDGNKSLVDQCRELGLNFIVLPRINKKSRAIEQGRQLFNRVTFHKTNCKRGLDCLREYHAHYNEAMQYFSPEPEHNWASHGADAYLYMAQAILQERRHTVGAQRERAVFRSSIYD